MKVKNYRALIVDNGTLVDIIQGEGTLLGAICGVHRFISVYSQHPILMDARIFDGEEEVWKYPTSVQREFPVELSDGSFIDSIGKTKAEARKLLIELGYDVIRDEEANPSLGQTQTSDESVGK